MPVDRLNTNNGRPLKPTLASTRTAKTPVTPRLAPSVASASSTQSARTVRSILASTPRANPAPQDDVSTPVKSFLGHNITPRSSSRKSRISTVSPLSTTNATPSSTHSSTRPASTIDFGSREQANGHGLPYNGWTGPRVTVGGNHSNTTSTPKSTISNIYNYPASEVGGSRGGASMFFHASEARPQETAPPPKKAPAFFHANGKQDASSRGSSRAPSPPLSTVGRPQPESKFFHADSIPEAKGTPPVLPEQPFSASPEVSPNIAPTQPALASLQTPSPSKENHVHLPYRKGASQVIHPNLNRGPSALSTISGSHASNTSSDSIRRRSSAASTLRFNHGKSASLSSIDSVTSLKNVTPNDISLVAASPLQNVTPNDISLVAASPLQNERRVINNDSFPNGVASAPLLPPETLWLSGLPSPGLQSPNKTSNEPSVLDRMNELAANARRERKVLDLEISNSSLLAINRSLEREVRKQKAEIRMFRRMSRAGRFSMDTVSSDPEGFMSIGVIATDNPSGMLEGEDKGQEQEEVYGFEEEDSEISDESSFDESTMSPTTLAARDATHLEKDEKRLQLDLSKHQELILDSQKMNQSLKKCLNWTEELIKEGQNALAYQVRVSEVKLGGRVLVTAEDTEDEGEGESRGLLSPWTPSILANDPFESTSLHDSDRTDRDSGVDLEALKSLPPELHAYISPLGSPMADTPSRPRLSWKAEGMNETH